MAQSADSKLQEMMTTKGEIVSGTGQNYSEYNDLDIYIAAYMATSLEKWT